MQKVKKKCRKQFKEDNIEAVSEYQYLIWKAFEIGLGYLIYAKIFVKYLLFVWAPL